MKKSLMIWISVSVIAAAACIYFLLNTYSFGSFSVSDFRYFQLYFSSNDITLGKIPNAAVAKGQAEKVWVDIYGESVMKDEKPYKVSFDSENGIWLVHGSLPPNWLGGVAFILIQKDDGKVLAVWHGQ